MSAQVVGRASAATGGSVEATLTTIRCSNCSTRTNSAKSARSRSTICRGVSFCGRSISASEAIVGPTLKIVPGRMRPSIASNSARHCSINSRRTIRSLADSHRACSNSGPRRISWPATTKLLQSGNPIPRKAGSSLTKPFKGISPSRRAVSLRWQSWQRRLLPQPSRCRCAMLELSSKPLFVT